MAVGSVTRILIVDDHTLLRQAVREILDAELDLHVIAEAGNSDEAVQMADRSRPDVILLDVEIPGDDVRMTTRRLARCSPGSRVIILSMYDEPQLVQDLLTLGVRGYLLKSVTRQELVSAIRSVSADDGRVVLAVSRRSLANTDRQGSNALSSREVEVLVLTAQALSNAQIGARLSITEGTVKRHLRNVFAKLGAVSRIDAVNKAVEASLVNLPSPRRSPSPPSSSSTPGNDRPPGAQR
jgi:DNA-binding NarL/FixJ family response regulator